MRAASTRFRLPIAFALAVVVTGGVFGFLHALVGASLELSELKPASRIEFTRLRRDTEVRAKRRDKVELERPVPVPTTPQMSRLNLSAASAPVEMIAPTVDTRASLGRISVNLGGSDRDAIPLVRINPDYPARAVSRGIEGWVLVQFTITPAGTVKDAKVMDAEPKGYFEAAALKAISRWKYNPMIDGGVAVERRGIQVMLSFKLDQS